MEGTESPNEKRLLPIRYDWYQTESQVIITVLVKNISEDYLQLLITKNQINIKISHPEFDICNLCLNLSNSIVAEQSNYKLTPSKIEIKLKKLEGLRWEQLEGPPVEVAQEAAAKPKEVEVEGPPAYPTSKKGKDWNKIEKEIKEQEAKEKPDGDAAINKLFQEIYGKGSDDVKRAMNKSYMESGGTVLSTNWSEISRQKVDVKPPDGMEWKKWAE